MVGVCELVGPGHPDKVADYVADYILEELHTIDPTSRAAIEVLLTRGEVYVGGEFYCPKKLSSRFFTIKAREALTNILTDEMLSNLEVNVSLFPQSPEIVDTCMNSSDLRIPDQGVAYGFADANTERNTPFSHTVARDIYDSITHLICEKWDGYLLEDFKILVTTKENMVDSVTCSIAHKKCRLEDLRRLVGGCIQKALKIYQVTPDFSCSINPHGEFLVNGFFADSGTTNRKIVADSYGCDVRHGGGGFSGKDMTKPDRLLAYWARFVAKNAIGTNLCTKCESRVIYRYGEHFPVIEVKTDSTNPLFDRVVEDFMTWNYNSIYNYFKEFGDFTMLTTEGHFGYDENGGGFLPPWECSDYSDRILEALAKVEKSA